MRYVIHDFYLYAGSSRLILHQFPIVQLVAEWYKGGINQTYQAWDLRNPLIASQVQIKLETADLCDFESKSPHKFSTYFTRIVPRKS